LHLSGGNIKKIPAVNLADEGSGYKTIIPGFPSFIDVRAVDVDGEQVTVAEGNTTKR